MVPPTNLYFKGYHYFSSASAWRTLNRRAHENGMYTVTYVAIFLQALGGSEFMRKHPEYISFMRDGSVTGEISTVTTPYFRDYYRDYPESVKHAYDQPMYTPGLRGTFPDTLNTIVNVTDLEAVKLGVQSYLEGREFFGYDGVRFDGHYLVPALGDPLAPASMVMDWQGRPQPTGKQADELSARNMRYAIGTTYKRYPDFMFGFNDASLRPDANGDEVLERAVSKITYPGSYILDEVAKGALVNAAPDNRWEDMIRIQGIQADRARKLGAFLHSGWPPGPGQKEVDTRQIKAMGWAPGAALDLRAVPPQRRVLPALQPVRDALRAVPAEQRPRAAAGGGGGERRERTGQPGRVVPGLRLPLARGTALLDQPPECPAGGAPHRRRQAAPAGGSRRP